MRSGNVASALVDAARNLAGGCIGAASGLQRARGAVQLAGTVEKRDPVVHEGAAGRQGLAGGTGIRVGALVVAELPPREGPIPAPGLVDDRGVRRDLLLLDQ